MPSGPWLCGRSAGISARGRIMTPASAARPTPKPTRVAAKLGGQSSLHRLLETLEVAIAGPIFLLSREVDHNKLIGFAAAPSFGTD